MPGSPLWGNGSETSLNRLHHPDGLDAAGIAALILGAISFATLWEAALFELDTAWPLALIIHGISIATIAFGLIRLQRGVLDRSARLTWVGIILAVVGSFASFVLLSVGLALVGVAVCIQRGWRAGPIVVILGSATLLASYLLGARIGTEGAPDPSTAAAASFGIAALLIPLGLILIAIAEARLIRSDGTAKTAAGPGGPGVDQATMNPG